MKGREEVTMKKTMVKRLMSWVLAAAMVVAMLPVSVLGAEPGGNVAKIGETEYATLDEAVEEAKEGATIELLTDCELTKGFNKTLTFTGNGKISINKQLTSNGEGWMCFGLGDPTRVLTFDGAGVEVEWNSEVGTSPWLMLSLSGTMNVTNGAQVTFTVDSGATGSRNAIYMNAGSVINVTKGSSFTIKGNETAGKEGQGIQLDKAAQSKINVTDNSSFIIDGTNRGYVNSPTIYVEDSTFTVRNCTANASNGGNFTAVNSQVLYQDNAGHGLSASNIVIQNSSLVADNNGYYGIYDSGKFEVDSTSEVVVTRNSADGDFAGLKLTSGVTDGKVEAGAVITITDNYCSGLSNNGVCVFEEGAKLTIMNNKNDKGTSSHGGGIYNSGVSAKLTLPSNAVIYNNHSKTDGDDIFNNTTATITFGKVGSDWVLDDCNHLIDGWYLDGEGTRWQVCKLEEGEKPYAVEYPLESETVTVTGLTALKAAHGLEPKDKVSYPGLDKKVGDDDEAMNNVDVDAAAGQKVNFQLISNVPTDLLNYLNPEAVTPPFIDGEKPGTAEKVEIEGRGEYVLTFHDKLNEKLTNLENYVVKIGDTELTTEQYKVLTPTDECSFEIALDLAKLYEDGEIKDADIKNATLITVTYDATLSEEAKAGRYENTAWVTAPKDWKTSEDIVYVNTYAIDIFKYDQAEPTKGLEGAEFELYQKNTEGNVIEASKKTLISGADGKILVDGLDAGTYYLKETKAPDGYVCSTAELEIVIPDKAGVNNMVGVSFANSQIPHTGGTGTLMFTIGGIALMGTAGLLLVVSRKKRKA